MMLEVNREEKIYEEIQDLPKDSHMLEKKLKINCLEQEYYIGK